MQLGTSPRHDRRRRRTTHPFYEIDDSQRLRHIYVLGASGTGKSTTLKNWIIKDIRDGLGCFFLDPHGQDSEHLLQMIPPERRRDVVYFNPSEFPIGFNVLDGIPRDRRAFVASSIVDTFKTVWNLGSAPNIEMFVFASIAALLETPGSTLLGLNYILTSPSYRAKVLRRIGDPVVRDFWANTFEHHMTEREQRDRSLSTINKIFTLIADSALRNCLGQKSAFDFKSIIAGKKIFIACLPHGSLGIEKSSIIGSFLLSSLHTAALQRTDDLSVFPVYIDEFHHFGNRTVMEMAAGLRKFGISLCVAHQYMAQLTPEMRAAILGTFGTVVSFQIGPEDAETLAKQFRRTKPDDLVMLPPYRACVRSAATTIELSMPPYTGKHYPSGPRKIRDNCRSAYAGKSLAEVEREIAAFVAAAAPKPRSKAPRPPVRERDATAFEWGG